MTRRWLAILLLAAAAAWGIHYWRSSSSAPSSAPATLADQRETAAIEVASQAAQAAMKIDTVLPLSMAQPIAAPPVAGFTRSSAPAERTDARFGVLEFVMSNDPAQLPQQLERLTRLSAEGRPDAAFGLAMFYSRCARTSPLDAQMREFIAIEKVAREPDLAGDSAQRVAQASAQLRTPLDQCKALGVDFIERTEFWLDRARELGSIASLSAYATLGMLRYTAPPPVAPPRSGRSELLQKNYARLEEIVSQQQRAMGFWEAARKRGSSWALHDGFSLFGGSGAFPTDRVRAYACVLALARVPGDRRAMPVFPATVTMQAQSGLTQDEIAAASKLADRYVDEFLLELTR
jgi:hypothetical protein